MTVRTEPGLTVTWTGFVAAAPTPPADLWKGRRRLRDESTANVAPNPSRPRPPHAAWHGLHGMGWPGRR